MEFPDTAIEIVMSLGGLLMIGGAGVPLYLMRRDPERMRVVLPVIGRTSVISSTIAGLATVGVGYHLLVHGLDLAHFRAPLGVAVVVGIVAVLGSLLVDGAENRLLSDEAEAEEVVAEDQESRSGR